MIKIGVIADDFTGATDIASFLVENGLPTRYKLTVFQQVKCRKQSRRTGDQPENAPVQWLKPQQSLAALKLVATARLQTDLFQILLYFRQYSER